MPTDEQLAGAQVLYLWDHRFAELGALLRRAHEVRWVHAASVGVNRLLCPEGAGCYASPTPAVCSTFRSRSG